MSIDLRASHDLNRVFSNAVRYRLRRIRESVESTIDEVISDIPHIRDFINSSSELAISIYDLNVSGALGVLPKFLLSSTGVLAAIPNIITIDKERRDHKSELKATLVLKRQYDSSQDPDVIDRNEALELEGFETSEAPTLSERGFEDARRVAFKSAYERVGFRLANPEMSYFKSCAIGALSFTWKTLKDCNLNFARSKSRYGILEGASKGLQNTIKCRFREKAEIDKLANLKTISEKITEAQSKEADSIIVQGRDIAIKMLDPDSIKRLDRIREATRDKAQQLKTATKGFGLQGTFISASLGLCVWHLSEGHYFEAYTQFCSANLASNPLRFVGEQTEELYRAIHSERVKEAEILAREIEDAAGLPINGDPPASPQHP